MEQPTTEFQKSLDGLMLLTGGQQLPTLPVLMIQVQRALANEMTGLQQLSAIIERDPALTTRLLRAANSAAFARGDPVTAISAAVGRLGTAHVRSLCLAVGVVRAFGGSSQRLDHGRYWQHSAAVGLVAERLTRLSRRYPGLDGQEAYVAGLLHDVGLLVIDQFFPDYFAAIQAEMDAELAGRYRIEETRLGLDHGAVGGRLLARWQLPPTVVAAVTGHHHPDRPDTRDVPMAAMTWAAEALCTACGLELPQEGIADVGPSEVMDYLEIPQEQRDPLIGEVGGLGETARQFTE